jgi:hypothetical protein
MLPSSRNRLVLGVGLIALAGLATWYGNQIAPNIQDLSAAWNRSYLFPLMTPVGADFRNGVYLPGSLLAIGLDPYGATTFWYPPFSALFFLPFQLIAPDRAYMIHTFVLILLNFASIGCVIRLTKSVVPAGEATRETRIPGMTLPLFLSLAFVAVSSYGFLFSIERGNFDLYAMAFSLAGLWILIRSPNRIWLQVLCVSVAAHLKVYPAVLLLLLLWKHGRRCIVPMASINAALLLCIGLTPALHFIDRLSDLGDSLRVWVGNHSAASFGQMVNEFLGIRGLPAISGMLFLGAPVMVWLGTVWILLRRGYSNTTAVWLFAATVPLMNLVPSTSHDYKLVLLGAPFTVLLVHLLDDYVSSGRPLALAQMAAACTLLAILSVSYVAFAPVLGNKYPFIVGCQLLLLWVLLTLPSASGQRLPSRSEADHALPTP